jgi:RNA polymerase sigma-70 factor (ECF subfamily)
MSDLSSDADGGGLAEHLVSHLDSAYSLACWLVRNADAAEDVVQEAYLRALKHSGGFRDGNARAWLLTIVRNTAYSWLRKTRACEPVVQFDEDVHTRTSGTSNPEKLLLENADRQFVEETLTALPVRFREILVLRELEGCSYKEIAAVMGMPMGTVMSTLSRARDSFRKGVAGVSSAEARSM